MAAAGDLIVSGIRLVHVSPDPTTLIKVPVAGNQPIAKNGLIWLSSGKAKEFDKDTLSDGIDNFVGVALNGNRGDEPSTVVNWLTVSRLCVIDAMFATAPPTGATGYLGEGVAVTSAGPDADNHTYLFELEASGVEQIGWLYERGAGTGYEERRVLIDTMAASKGQQVAGGGFWHQNAAE